MEMEEKQVARKKYWEFKSMNVTIILCLLVSSIGYAYVFDIPGSLQETLMKEFHLSSFKFSLLYSIYSLPCLIISPCGGFLIDSPIGLRKSTFLFSIIVAIGSALFAAGGPLNTFPLMLVGRFLLGCGLEMLQGPCVICYIFIWFKGSYLNLAFSLTDNFCYIGTTLVFSVSNRLYESMTKQYPDLESLNLTLIIDSCIVVIPLVCFMFIDLKIKSSGNVKKRDAKCSNARFTDFLKFPTAFWLICFTYSSIINTVYTFEAFSQGFFVSEYGMTVIEASYPLSVMYGVIIVLAIPLSLLVDRFGRNMFVLILSVLVGQTALTLLMFKVNPYFSMSVLGISYALTASSIWPMAGYLLKESNYGTGYGIQDSFINLTSSIYPLVTGKIIDLYGYTWVEIFYLILLGLTLLVLALMWIVDRRSSVILSMSARQRKLYNEDA